MKNFWDDSSLEHRAEMYSHTQQGEYADLVAPLAWNDLSTLEKEALYRVVWLGLAKERP